MFVTEINYYQLHIVIDRTNILINRITNIFIRVRLKINAFDETFCENKFKCGIIPAESHENI